MVLCINVPPWCCACTCRHGAVHARANTVLCMHVPPRCCACTCHHGAVHARATAVLCMHVPPRCCACTCQHGAVHARANTVLCMHAPTRCCAFTCQHGAVHSRANTVLSSYRCSLRPIMTDWLTVSGKQCLRYGELHAGRVQTLCTELLLHNSNVDTHWSAWRISTAYLLNVNYCLNQHFVNCT